MSILNGATLICRDPRIKSKKAVLQAFMDNKDFTVVAYGIGGSTAINRPQIEEEDVRSIRVRFQNNRKILILSRDTNGKWKTR